jgi:hypothetical protein
MFDADDRVGCGGEEVSNKTFAWDQWHCHIVSVLFGPKIAGCTFAAEKSKIFFSLAGKNANFIQNLYGSN